MIGPNYLIEMTKKQSKGFLSSGILKIEIQKLNKYFFPSGKLLKL